MSAPEIHRFPLKSVEQRATVAKSVAPAPVAVAPPAAETRVVYVEKKVQARATAGYGMISQAAYANDQKASTTQAYSSVKISKQQMIGYDYTIDDTLPPDGNAIWKVQFWNYLDPFAIRCIQVYERVCPSSCPSKCPENCIKGVPGLLVSTENATTFGSESRAKIVGAIPFSTYHTGDEEVTATSIYKYSFVNLELATITTKVANQPVAYLKTLLRPTQVDSSIVSGLESGQVATQELALETLLQGQATAGEKILSTLTNTLAPYYVLVYCNGDKCADTAVLDVFSWYLARIHSVTLVGTTNAFTIDNIKVQPLSPACEYPSDTEWATLRDKGGCVSLPTAEDKNAGFAIDPRDKVPIYFSVPSYKYKIGSDINGNNYSVSVPKANYGNKIDKLGAVPQGTASHLIGLQYCVRGDGLCQPSVFSILAGQMCSCRLDSRIWGFRVMFYDYESTSSRRANRWGQLIPQKFDAPDSYGNKPFNAISWALTTEASSANGYSIADSVLQIPIERHERTGTTGESTTINFTKIRSTKFRVDFILNPDPEGSSGVTYTGSQGAGAPPMSATTAVESGVNLAPYPQQPNPTVLTGYRYQRLNVNCSKKFSVTDLQIHGAMEDCSSDNKVLRQLRVHNNPDVEDIPVDSREISVECSNANVTTVLHARLSEGSERKEFHFVAVSNLISLKTPFLEQEYVDLTEALFRKIGSLEMYKTILSDAADAGMLSGTWEDGYSLNRNYSGDGLQAYENLGLTRAEVFAILTSEHQYGSLKYDYTMRPFEIRGLGETVTIDTPDAEFLDAESFD